MPDEDGVKAQEDGQGEIVTATKEDELPPITPPQTKTPVTFNQQINYQQIPPSAWDGLTPDQRIELSKTILEKMDVMDRRHFDFAIKQVDIETRRGTVRALCGTLIAILGFAISAYLALHEETIVGLSISLPVATIIAIIVGNRVITRL